MIPLLLLIIKVRIVMASIRPCDHPGIWGAAATLSVAAGLVVVGRLGANRWLRPLYVLPPASAMAALALIAECAFRQRVREQQEEATQLEGGGGGKDRIDRDPPPQPTPRENEKSETERERERIALLVANGGVRALSHETRIVRGAGEWARFFENVMAATEGKKVTLEETSWLLFSAGCLGICHYSSEEGDEEGLDRLLCLLQKALLSYQERLLHSDNKDNLASFFKRTFTGGFCGYHPLWLALVLYSDSLAQTQGKEPLQEEVRRGFEEALKERMCEASLGLVPITVSLPSLRTALLLQLVEATEDRRENAHWQANYMMLLTRWKGAGIGGEVEAAFSHVHRNGDFLAKIVEWTYLSQIFSTEKMLEIYLNSILDLPLETFSAKGRGELSAAFTKERESFLEVSPTTQAIDEILRQLK